MRVIVRSSPIHAAGVFALDHIPKGTRVLEYTGERMRHEAADDLYEHRPYTYLFGFGDGSRLIIANEGIQRRGQARDRLCP